MPNTPSSLPPITYETELAYIFEKHYDNVNLPPAGLLMSLGTRGWRTVRDMLTNPDWVQQLEGTGWDGYHLRLLRAFLVKAGLTPPFTKEEARAVLAEDDQAERIAKFLLSLPGDEPIPRLILFLENTHRERDLGLIERIQKTQIWQERGLPPFLPVTSLADLNLSSRAINALDALGITTLAEAQEKQLKASALLKCRNCGKHTVREIGTAFREAGIPLINDSRLPYL